MDAKDFDYLRNINTSPGPNAGRSIDPTQPGPDATRIAELERESLAIGLCTCRHPVIRCDHLGCRCEMCGLPHNNIHRAELSNTHVNPPRAGDYMFTFTGRYWPLDPRAEEVRIEDIAHHLAFQCRYNGACTDYLSIAEHSYWCSYEVPAEDALEALLHDAAEAYIGDIIRPLKNLAAVKAFYNEIEAKNELAIAMRFGLQWPWPRSIKIADEAVCMAEMRQLIASSAPNYCVDQSRIANIVFPCWPPNQAKLKFMQRFNELRRD